jgi:hypothetical protein
MQNPIYTVTGTITDANTVKLDKALPLGPVKVRLTIEAVPGLQPNRYEEVMAEIRQRQRTRNHQSPAAEDVQRFVDDERQTWE